jgi:asparagine synthase (glutamine-hydrolysing)
MADDILAKEGARTPRLDTLSFYDKTEPSGDDWIYFQKIEKKRGRVGAHLDASKLGSCPASLVCPDFQALPGSLSDGEEIESERACIIRDGGYRAVLSGIGGDEFLGGNPDPRSHLADLIVQFKVIRLAKQLTAWSLIKRRPWIHLLWQASMDLLPASLGQYFVEQANVERWIEKDFAQRTKLATRQLDVAEHFGCWLPTRRSYIGGVVLMANRLAKSKPPVDALEENRFPYLDQGLIEFILSIPAGQLLRPGERRSLMRRSLAALVPQEILCRRTKQFGARTPVVALEKNLKQLQIVFSSPLSSRLGYVSQARFLKTLRDAINGKTVHLVRLLRTISLEIWLQGLQAHRLIEVTPTSPRAVAVGSLQASSQRTR